MSYFRNIISKLFTVNPLYTTNSLYTNDTRVLGRWTMNYSKDHLDRKIYLANHDHCGPCGSIYELPKVNSK